ncbi:hypothetical protein M758_UG048200 [Ceratodon purpureus]|nr:hypothetical protein M758_UG048200 [Ceratodon purpureus]
MISSLISHSIFSFFTGVQSLSIAYWPPHAVRKSKSITLYFVAGDKGKLPVTDVGSIAGEANVCGGKQDLKGKQVAIETA